MLVQKVIPMKLLVACGHTRQSGQLLILRWDILHGDGHFGPSNVILGKCCDFALASKGGLPPPKKKVFNVYFAF